MIGIVHGVSISVCVGAVVNRDDGCVDDVGIGIYE